LSPNNTTYATAKLVQLAEGDERVFGELYTHYYTRLRPFIHRFVRSDSDTEEVIQETFVRIWLSRDKLPEIENLDAWIYRIASRECLSHLRKSRRARLEMSLVPEEHQYALVSGEMNPAEKLGADQMYTAIERYIENMPKQRKKIYRLSREEGLKPSEIAELLSLSVSTIKNTLSASLKEIRSHLIKLGFDNLTLLLALFFSC